MNSRQRRKEAAKKHNEELLQKATNKEDYARRRDLQLKIRDIGISCWGGSLEQLEAIAEALGIAKEVE